MNRSQMRRITKKIAKNNKASITEVKHEMQAAITAAYKNPTPAGLAVPRKGNVPTPQEFIGYVSGKIINQSNDTE